jgi:uncharacterized protein
MKKLILLIPILFYFSGIIAQSENNLNVVVERTEVKKLYSEIVGQEYELFISLPKSYNSGNTSYPVIIGLDAYTTFLITKGCIDAFTSLYPLMPEVILVGIGYGGDESNSLAKWIAGRTRDFTPVKDIGTEQYYEQFITGLGYETTKVQSGGALLFLDFLHNELLPYINSNYRIDNKNKALMGASLGGLFALYTLFHAPETFNKYFIESPSIQYSNEITYDYENNYAKNHTDLNAEIFMCAGSLENPHATNVKKMESLLLSRNYANLHLETVIFENENHISCAPAAISRGLIELFNNDK